MNYTHSNHRRKLVFGIIIVVFFLFIAGRYLVLPHVRAYASATVELNAATKRLAESVEAVSMRSKEEQMLNEARERLQVLKTEFQGLLENGELLTRLETQAREKDVVITHFQPQPAIEHTYYRELPVKITIEGTFTSVLGYLSGIERPATFQNVAELETLEIKPFSEGGNESPGLIIAEIKLAFFGLKDNSNEAGSPKEKSNRVRENAFLKPEDNSPKPVLVAGEDRHNSVCGEVYK